MQKYEAAIRYLGKAAVRDPGNSKLTSSLARLSAWNGQYTQAISPFLLSLAVTSNQYSADSDNNQLLLECFKHSNKDEAMKQVQEICNGFDPAKHNAGFHNLLGEDMRDLGWNDAAIEQFKTALSLSPKFGLAQFNLAKEYEFYAHDYTNALEFYRQAQLNGAPDLHAGDYANRLEERLVIRKGDIAWQIRDWFSHAQH
jgi:tetratricopeptide (TPR) repeat protein